MNNPLVSIIVLIYNRELSVGYCIDSILNLIYKSFELPILREYISNINCVRKQCVRLF